MPMDNQDGYRHKRLIVPDDELEKVEVVAVVSGPKAKAGYISVGEERIVRTKTGYRPRHTIFVFGVILAVLGAIGASLAWPQDLTDYRNKSASQISNTIKGDALNVAYFLNRIGDLGYAYKNAFIHRSLTPYDFSSNITTGLDSAFVRDVLFQVPTGIWALSTYSTPANKGLRIVGTSAERPKDTELVWPFDIGGSVLRSTDSTGTAHLLKVGYSGQDVYNMSLIGYRRLNGVGFYGFRGDGVNTTQGDYSINNSLTAYNGSDGIRYVSADGNHVYTTDSFNNKGYGINFVSTYGNYLDGFQSFPSSNGNEGGYFLVQNGRTRYNTKGGVHSFQQIGGTLFNVQSVTDSSAGFYFQGLGTTSGSADHGRANARPLIIQGDSEFAVPRAAFATERSANMKFHNVAGLTVLNSYWGSVHTQGTYTADAGTNTTTIQDTQIKQRPTNYYVGWKINNSTRSSGDVAVTASANSGTSTILTLTSSVTGQTTGDTYALKLKPRRGLYADSLWSAMIINSTHASEADSPFVYRNFAYPFFLGTMPNFDPKTDQIMLGGGTLRYASILMDRLATSGNLQIQNNGELTVEANSKYSGGDSLNLYATSTSHGIRMIAGQVIEMQPGISTDTGNQGDVFVWRGLSNEMRPEFRLYGDANIAVGTGNIKYLTTRYSASQSNAITFSGSDDTLRAVFAMPLELSGNAGMSRFMDVLGNSSAPTPSILTNRIRLYVKTGTPDTLYAADDLGNTQTLMPQPAGTGDITAVVAGDGLSGGATSGSATVTFNPKLTGQTLAITSDSVHVKDTSISPGKLTAAANTRTFFFSKLDTCKAADGFGVVKVPSAITITEIAAFTDQGTVTFNIEQRAETTPNTSGTDVLSADLVADNDQQESTGFADATVPANTWLYYSASAVSGNADEVTVTIKYTVD